MKIVTKDHRDIECRFISFTEDGIYIMITLWDGEIVNERVDNLDYIAIS